jgi:hypothetical protein
MCGSGGRVEKGGDDDAGDDDEARNGEEGCGGVAGGRGVERLLLVATSCAWEWPLPEGGKCDTGLRLLVERDTDEAEEEREGAVMVLDDAAAAFVGELAAEFAAEEDAEVDTCTVALSMLSLNWPMRWNSVRQNRSSLMRAGTSLKRNSATEGNAAKMRGARER